MNKIFVCLLIPILSGHISFNAPANTKTFCPWDLDSSLHQRFIASLLTEYELPGRWIYVKMDSCDGIRWNEIVEPMSIFKGYSSTMKNLTSSLFVQTARNHFYQNIPFNRCFNMPVYGTPKNIIQGLKVNEENFSKLRKKPIEKILNKYFDRDKRLKKKYKSMQTEIIAVCFLENIKVLTLDDNNVIYEIFK